MRLSYHRADQQEIDDACTWYDERKANLGDEFFQALEELLNRIASNPEAFPQSPFGRRRVNTGNRKYDGIGLAGIYARRWDIGLKPHDLKTMLGMEFFALKSPAMAHKTLWMSLIAFNYIRSEPRVVKKTQKPPAPQRPAQRIRRALPPQAIQEICLIPCHTELPHLRFQRPMSPQ